MSLAVQLALWLVRWACSQEHREEIEGDLRELHAGRLTLRGPFRAGLEVLFEALDAAHRRPAEALMQSAQRLVLVSSGVAVAIAYLLLTIRVTEPSLIRWPLVLVGTMLELWLWYLLFNVGRNRASHGS